MSERAFNENSFYQGEVVSQNLTFSGKNAEIPQLVLDVRLTGELIDSRKPDRGAVPCPDVTVEVRLAFDHQNEARLEMAQKDLLSLGFDGDDLELLNPANKKHHDLTGRKVYVMPRYKTYNDREQLFWNLRFPQVRHDKPAEKGSVSKSAAAQAYKDLVRRKKQEAGEEAPY